MARPLTFDGTDRPQQALLDACVHCGFCLPTCPTYLLWGEEMDSPRGRIYLMQAANEGRAGVTPVFVDRFDNCLGCMACVTACPSGVQYGPLIERTRGQIERLHPRPFADRVWRTLLFRVLPYPRMLRLTLTPLALLPRPALVVAVTLFSKASRRLAAAMALLPPGGWRVRPAAQPAYTPAAGLPRRRVGLLLGCVQRVLMPEVNEATRRVLVAEGCETLVPSGQGCCGALSRHAGRLDEARAFARRTIELFEAAGVDAVVVNAAGCGSSMKEYGELFEDDPAWHTRAQRFSASVRDVSELLVELGAPRAERHSIAATVAYHDACHLAHAQGIRTAPRILLSGIPGVTLVDLPESEICCGSAGTYNILQPEPAAALGERKARHLAAVSPDVVVSANPGCVLQLTAACTRLGESRQVLHPIELLDASIRGSRVQRGEARERIVPQVTT